MDYKKKERIKTLLKVARIIRLILTFALVCGVYFETGVITAVSIFLLFSAGEILPLKTNKTLKH